MDAVGRGQGTLFKRQGVAGKKWEREFCSVFMLVRVEFWREVELLLENDIAEVFSPFFSPHRARCYSRRVRVKNWRMEVKVSCGSPRGWWGVT